MEVRLLAAVRRGELCPEGVNSSMKEDGRGGPVSPSCPAQ
jgi:hypothetical protein